MENVCSMLGFLPGYQENFRASLENTDSYSSSGEANQNIMESSRKSIIKAEDGSDLIPDAEHEYRLQLRMLQYRLRDQPSEFTNTYFTLQCPGSSRLATSSIETCALVIFGGPTENFCVKF